MVDFSRRKFIKQTFKFSVATTAAVATFPMINLYQEKVRPVLAEKYPDSQFSSDLTLLQNLTPHLIIGTSVMSFILTYADQLETFAILLLAILSLLLVGLPVSQEILLLFT